MFEGNVQCPKCGGMETLKYVCYPHLVRSFLDADSTIAEIEGFVSETMTARLIGLLKRRAKHQRGSRYLDLLLIGVQNVLQIYCKGPDEIVVRKKGGDDLLRRRPGKVFRSAFLNYLVVVQLGIWLDPKRKAGINVGVFCLHDLSTLGEDVVNFEAVVGVSKWFERMFCDDRLARPLHKEMMKTLGYNWRDNSCSQLMRNGVYDLNSSLEATCNQSLAFSGLSIDQAKLFARTVRGQLRTFVQMYFQTASNDASGYWYVPQEKFTPRDMAEVIYDATLEFGIDLKELARTLPLDKNSDRYKEVAREIENLRQELLVVGDGG